MKKLVKIMMLLSAVIIILTACSKNEGTGASGEKATIDNLVLSPTDNVKYGDIISLTGVLSDNAGLFYYTVSFSNADSVIYQKPPQMLTGKTFNVNESLIVPLYPNAVAGDLTLSLTVKNSSQQLTTQDVQIKNVGLPTFSTMYLVLNGTTYPMVKNGNVYEYEGFIPANATGKIYTSTDKTGIFWGADSDAGTNIKVMGTSDLAFGKSDEQYFKISFDPASFNLTLGDPVPWSPLTGDDLYILGTISGHWEDNAAWLGHPNGIDTEAAKMKMTAYSLNNRKMWIWTPPNTGTGNSADDMWGNTVAGVFRLKKAGQAQYITYVNGQIATTSANSLDNNFPIPVAGQFNIRVMADETGITSVIAFDNGLMKTLEFKNGAVMLNGLLAPPSISFAGSPLSLVPGNYFLYQGTIDLTNGQSVTADGIDLSALYCDNDAFSGGGNRTWQVVAPTSTYYVRIDAFSGHSYIRETTGYPTAIYMDGWCWKKYPGDPRSNWNSGTEMSLYRVGTANVYEATCYIQPWAGDIKFFAIPSTVDNIYPGGVISAQYFNIDKSQIMTDNVGILLPVPDDPDGLYYKISVDLKDGMTTDADGNYVPVGAKFTCTFTQR